MRRLLPQKRIPNRSCVFSVALPFQDRAFPHRGSEACVECLLAQGDDLGVQVFDNIIQSGTFGLVLCLRDVDVVERQVPERREERGTDTRLLSVLPQ